MGLRHRPGQRTAQLGGPLRRIRIALERHAIGQQRLQPAVGQPVQPVAALVEEVEHRLLVVAQQPHCSKWVKPGSGSLSSRSTTPRLRRAAVDVVAQEDQAALGVLGMLRRLGGNAAEQHLEQVGPAVDIADGVDGVSSGDGRRLSRQGRSSEPP